MSMDPLSKMTRKLSAKLRSSRKQKGEKKVEKSSSGAKQLDRYVAVADYAAQEKGEMDLQVGMSVEVTEKSESGWWFANAEEHQGWVPSTYLQAASGSTAAHDSANDAQDGCEEKFICIETFTADNADEISVEKGAIVEVLQKNLDGWWFVRYQGAEGYAPATYLKKSTDPYAQNLVEKSRQSGVQIIGNLADVSNLMASSSASPRNSTILSSSPQNSAVPSSSPRNSAFVSSTGVSKEEEGEEEEEDVLRNLAGPSRESGGTKVMLKQRSLERGGSLKPPPRQSSIKQMVVSPPPPPASPAKPSTYITIADFEDTVGDGISFTTGESVTVLEKTPTGWWFVERGQDQGWVPESFLKPADTTTTQADSAVESRDIEEESDSEENSDEEEEQARPPTSALAGALQSRLKGMNGDSKVSNGDSKMPPFSAGRPPQLPGKAKPPALPGKPQSDSSQEQCRENVSSSHQDREPSSGLAGALKSRFESKPPGLPGKPGEKPGVQNKPSGPPTPPQKPGEKPGPPSLPSKPPGPPAPPSKLGGKPSPPSLASKPMDKPGVPFKPPEKPKPPGLPGKPGDKPMLPGVAKKPEGVEGSSAPGGVAGLASSLKSRFESKDQEGPAKPSFKPSVQTAKPTLPSKSFGGETPVKPGLPHKPTAEGKPSLGQKPSLPFKKSSALEDTKPSANFGPPKLPFKPQAGSKPLSDPNNNTGAADRPVSGKVHGLAAAFGKQDAGVNNAKDAKPRPTLPVKKPTPSQHPAQKPSGDLNFLAGKPRVGNLVSELSGKLQFGGGGGGGVDGRSKSPERSPTNKAAPWSSQPRDNSNRTSGPPQMPKAMQNLLAKPQQPAAAAVSKGAEYEAVADFAAEGEGELCLQCGDVVEVVDQQQQDWWLVRLHGEEGWVPSSYLDPASQWED